eukprot:INCI6187.16.p2 GENE.INCI6187.16~~INCI6187.16.p2  ORF type:complete len:121 (-),score=12.55 INCI6187.16:174-536(-)
MTTNSWQLQPRDYSTKQPQQQQQLQQAQQQGNSDNENMKTTNTKHNNDYHDHGSATCQYGNDNRHEVGHVKRPSSAFTPRSPLLFLPLSLSLFRFSHFRSLFRFLFSLSLVVACVDVESK